MKIVQITPGSGDNFYCENCLRDLELVKALRARGHDVLMVPLYLPVQIKQDEGITNAPIFYGGVNVYLQQKLALFRKTPRWIDKWLDSQRLLKWVAPKAGMTSAKDLEETTISMLRGEDGRQAKELDRLLDWLAQEAYRPDVICLSNVLLAGMAEALKRRLQVPVVCWLQDEEAFADTLSQPYADEAWTLMSQASQHHIDAFISVSRFYKERMITRLHIEPDKIHVVPLGINVDAYSPASEPPQEPVLGYLSRLCWPRGVDTLVDAFILLKQREGLERLRLHLGGGHNFGDKPFVQGLKSKLEQARVLQDVVIEEDFTFSARHRFLQGLSVMSVPEREEAAHALYVLEAQAMGIPVVEPRIGALPELLEKTGGGVLYEASGTDKGAKGLGQKEAAEALAQALEPLLRDREKAKTLGARGRQGVLTHFNMSDTAAATVRVCQDTMEMIHA